MIEAHGLFPCEHTEKNEFDSSCVACHAVQLYVRVKQLEYEAVENSKTIEFLDERLRKFRETMNSRGARVA